VIANGTVLDATSDCPKSQSMHFTSVYCNQHFLDIIFMEGAANVFLQLTDVSYITNTLFVACLIVIKLSKLAGSN
jgi:hypothetical protein